MKRRLVLQACIMALVSFAFPTTASGASTPVSKIEAKLAWVMAHSPAGGTLPVLVVMKDRANLSAIAPANRSLRQMTAIQDLRTVADRAQSPVLGQIRTWQAQGLATDLRRFWIFDGFGLKATPAVIAGLAARADVASVSLDSTIQGPAPMPVAASTISPEPNIALIGAQALWAKGFRGEGEVVATMDTGVDMTDADLAASWRGGTNSWYDPYGQHSTSPVDLNGHGTQVMGVIVGAGAGGTAIGVAPGAKWISVKMFDDRGSATVSGIHAGFQWLLDPDGNPATPDSPNVVDESWTLVNPGCDLTFQPDLQALQAAGILPIFAAGNGGPAAGTSFSPANNPEAFAVGATDNTDGIASFSSRGPTTCGGSAEVFPELVAPGVGINTSDLFGFFTHVDGTSIAAPQVAGALALLLQAFPQTSVADQASALEAGAVDLGVAGPDDVYGNGRIDLGAAYAWLQSHSAPPPVLLSIKARGSHTLGSLTGVQKKDIVSFDGTEYTMVFDGSSVGLGAVRLDAMARLSADSFLMSFSTPVTVPGLGLVDDSDVVRFDATSLGKNNTAGTFSMWFHGADVGLTTDAEDIDALALLPDGRVLLSTVGWASVPGHSHIRGQDVMAFTPTSLGTSTAGTFAYYLRGSKIGLADSTENVDAVDVGADGSVALSTWGAFSVAGVSGTGDDVFGCAPSAFGWNSGCTFSPALVLSGSASGLTGLGVDDFHR